MQLKGYQHNASLNIVILKIKQKFQESDLIINNPIPQKKNICHREY